MKTILIVLLFTSSCAFNKDFNPEKICLNERCFSVVQYHKISEPENAGIYFTDSIVENIPTKEYIFVEYSDFPFYVKWVSDTLYLRFPGWNLKANEINNRKINFSLDFTEKEKKEYGFYQNRKNFYKNIETEYEVFSRFDLEMDWH